MSRRGRIDSDKLTRRLIDLARAGIRPRCGDPDGYMWTSDHEQERKLAALWCTGCAAMAECAAAADANNERHGVWAGVDRTVRPGRAVAA